MVLLKLIKKQTFSIKQIGAITKMNFVKNHIKSFPKFKSHYSREHNPHKQYLDSSLTVNKMYELYVEHCKTQQRIPVNIHSYRNIFNTCFNLSFHKP